MQPLTKIENMLTFRKITPQYFSLTRSGRREKQQQQDTHGFLGSRAFQPTREAAATRLHNGIKYKLKNKTIQNKSKLRRGKEKVI